MNTLTYDELRKRMRKKPPLTCTHCQGHPSTDVHHIDGDHSNNEPSNITPWCKRCHNEHHDISDNLTIVGLYVRQYDAIQKQRMAMDNRIRAYRALRYVVSDAQAVELRAIEAELLGMIRKLLKTEPIYYGYLQKVKGCGPAIAAALIADIGDPGRFPTISRLWAYAGLDVRDGAAPRRQRGVKANWNHNLRKTAAYKLTLQFVKLKSNNHCLGRELYDRYKQFYQERDGGKIKPIQIERRARRKVAKVFLACLWLAWRKIKGLPVSEPYAFARLEGHHSIITPEDWAGEDWEKDLQLAFAMEEPESV